MHLKTVSLFLKYLFKRLLFIFLQRWASASVNSKFADDDDVFCRFIISVLTSGAKTVELVLKR